MLSPVLSSFHAAEPETRRALRVPRAAARVARRRAASLARRRARIRARVARRRAASFARRRARTRARAHGGLREGLRHAREATAARPSVTNGLRGRRIRTLGSPRARLRRALRARAAVANAPQRALRVYAAHRTACRWVPLF